MNLSLLYPKYPSLANEEDDILSTGEPSQGSVNSCQEVEEVQTVAESARVAESDEGLQFLDIAVLARCDPETPQSQLSLLGKAIAAGCGEFQPLHRIQRPPEARATTESTAPSTVEAFDTPALAGFRKLAQRESQYPEGPHMSLSRSCSEMLRKDGETKTAAAPPLESSDKIESEQPEGAMSQNRLKAMEEAYQAAIEKQQQQQLLLQQSQQQQKHQQENLGPQMQQQVQQSQQHVQQQQVQLLEAKARTQLPEEGMADFRSRCHLLKDVGKSLEDEAQDSFEFSTNPPVEISGCLSFRDGQKCLIQSPPLMDAANRTVSVRPRDAIMAIVAQKTSKSLTISSTLTTPPSYCRLEKEPTELLSPTKGSKAGVTELEGTSVSRPLLHKGSMEGLAKDEDKRKKIVEELAKLKSFFAESK